MILADTSVWVQHFRVGHSGFRKQLHDNAISIHPAVIGELATGTLIQREKTLQMLFALRRTKVATFEECLATIDADRLFGRGLAWVDVQLLVSARLSRVWLWTFDKNLQKAANAAGVAYAEA